MKCSIEDCEKTKIAARGMCWKHYLRWNRHGDATINKIKGYRSGRYVSMGYVMIHLGGNDYKAEHVLMAEKALGRPLPHGAEVHHVDRDRQNNNTKSPWNLVICPDHAYPLLLHRRARMLGYDPPWPGAKITDAQADEIRNLKIAQREIAERYGISVSAVKKICAGILRPALGGDHSS